MIDTIPKPSVYESAEDPNRFVTVSRLEITQILHALERRAVLVTAGVGGDSFFLTSILSVNVEADQVLIEAGRHNSYRARVLGGQKLFCTTSLDKIQIRFELESLELADLDGEEVFVAALPKKLMRLQRRNYFRMPTPMLKPVKCSLAIVRNNKNAAIELDLLDISCGGFAAITPVQTFSPEMGEEFECTLRLPDNDPLKTTVKACSVSTRTLPNNKTTQRLAFMFVELPQRSLAIIQRYLMQLELGRRAHASAR